MQVVFGGRGRGELAVHVGLVVTLVGVTCLLAEVALPTLFPGWDAAAYWLVAAWVALADILAGLLHELGHAAVALAHGRHVQRITLYGVAAAARRSAGQSPHEQLLSGPAGPLSHLVLAALFWTIWRLLPEGNLPLRVGAALPGTSNLAVGVLNLLPLRPLDGRHVLGAAARLVALKRGKARRKLRIVQTRKPGAAWPTAEVADRTRAA